MSAFDASKHRNAHQVREDISTIATDKNSNPLKAILITVHKVAIKAFKKRMPTITFIILNPPISYKANFGSFEPSSGKMHIFRSVYENSTAQDAI